MFFVQAFPEFIMRIGVKPLAIRMIPVDYVDDVVDDHIAEQLEPDMSWKGARPPLFESSQGRRLHNYTVKIFE